MKTTLCPNALRNNRATPFRRHMAATCVAALLAISAFSTAGFAQSAAPLDTSALPRPAALKQLVALPQTTIILSSEPVPMAAKAALTLLEASGWQRYVTPNSQVAPDLASETHYLKKGVQGLTLFVSKAPAHNNATSIQYSPMPLERDLPFPVNAFDIKFSPAPLHLDATVKQAPEALLTFYRNELSAKGWTLHSASDGSAEKRITTEEGLQHAFFTHAGQGALHVRAKKSADGHSTINIRSVPAGVLPGAQVARAPEPVAPQPNPQAGLHAGMSQQIDAMAQNLMKQAMQPPPKNPAFDAIAAAALNAARTRAEPTAKAPAPSNTSVASIVGGGAESALEKDESGGLPVPKLHSSKGHSSTPWRVEAQASVKANVASVMAFYTKELAARGWRAAGQPRTDGERVIVNYAAPEGPAELTLERKGNETEVNLLLRKQAEARAAGMLPKSGKAKIMLGNMMDSDSTVMLGRSSVKVAAGVGSKAANGPSFEVSPGKHRLTIKSPGQPDVSEDVVVLDGDVWGVLIGPGGALPLQVY